MVAFVWTAGVLGVLAVFFCVMGFSSPTRSTSPSSRAGRPGRRRSGSRRVPGRSPRHRHRGA
jgi:hypothetical protein